MPWHTYQNVCRAVDEVFTAKKLRMKRKSNRAREKQEQILMNNSVDYSIFLVLWHPQVRLAHQHLKLSSIWDETMKMWQSAAEPSGVSVLRRKTRFCALDVLVLSNNNYRQSLFGLGGSTSQKVRCSSQLLTNATFDEFRWRHTIVEGSHSCRRL